MSRFAVQSEKKIQVLNLAAQTTSNAYSQSILSLAVSIVRCLRESKDNTEERLRVLGRIFDISMACSDCVSKLPEGNQIKLSMAIKDLTDSLEEILAVTERMNSRGKVRKVLRRNADASSLKVAMDELDHKVRLFETRIQIVNTSAAKFLRSEARIEFITNLEETMIKVQAEELSYIQQNIRSGIHDALADLSSMPSKPQIFLGRDSEVEQVVDRLSVGPQSFVAILGPGGIGKTSLTVAAMHHPRAIDTFGRYRFYLPCESLKDAASLVAAIASLFQLESARPLAQLKRMLEATGLRILLTLDNFETPWETTAGRAAVEDVLASLASISSISLAVTLRGAERPGQISWTRPFIAPLQPLDHASARETFLVISDVDPSCSEIDELLAAVDYVPLAVTLMASLAQTTPCDDLILGWQHHKTSMLSRGYAGRLSNVDMSIEMSLNSPRLKAQPRALELLQILAILPNGVGLSEISKISPPSLNDAESSLLPALLQVSLVDNNKHDNNLRMLAPVREYIYSRHPISIENLSHLVFYHAGLLKQAYLSRGSRNSQSVAEALIPQFGNVCNTIALSLPERSLAAVVVQAIVHCAAFPPFLFAREVIVTLLREALQVSESLKCLKMQVDCLLWLRMHSHLSKVQVEELLDHTSVLCSDLGDKKRDILLFVSYSQLHSSQGNPVMARHCLEQAQSLFTAVTPFWLRLKVLMLDSRAAQSLGRLDDAVAICNKGLLLLQNDHESLHSNSKAHFYTIRGMCNMERSLFGIASADLELSMENSASLWSRAVKMGDYADALYMQSRLRSAKEAYECALAVRTRFDVRDHTASLQVYLGDIALLQGKVEDASNLYNMSLSSFQALEMPTEVVRPAMGLGDIELQSDRPYSAFDRYIQTDTLFRQRGFLTNPVYIGIILRLGDAEFKSRHCESALRYHVVACAWSCRRSKRLGVAQGLQRIGDLLFVTAESSSISDANSCYEVTLDLIRFLGTNRHIGDCLYRLGLVCLWRGDMLTSRKRFSQARGFYAEAESPEGEALCEERFADSELSRNELNEDFPSMPLATLLIY